MKRSRLPVVFLIVILVICLIPSVGLVAFGPSSAGGNEVAVTRPSLRLPDGRLNADYLSELSDYAAGSFFLRGELICAHNRLVAAVFGTSAEESVVLGRDGWLYYEPTLADYCMTSTMSGREVFSAARNLYLMQEYCAENGAQFVFVIAPNKNSLYPEHMPHYTSVGTERNAALLQQALSAQQICFTDLFAAFGAQSQPLYFAHDSHWNTQGAALAADCINRALGRDSDYFSADFSGRTSHTGDLYDMLYPGARDPETDPVYGGTLRFTHLEAGARPDSITLNTQGDGTGALLMFRDSFGNLLYPFLADSFASARFSRATNYDLTLVGQLEADCVVVELVERNLIWLVQNTPVMPAPERQMPEQVNAGGDGMASLAMDTAVRAPEGYVRVTGQLLAQPDEKSPVLICCGDAVYEAFLLDGGDISLCIPEGARGQCTVMCQQDGAWISYATGFGL